MVANSNATGLRNICQRKCLLVFFFPTVIFLLCTGGIIFLSVHSKRYPAVLYPGALVELVNFPYFLYDKVQLSEDVEEGAKADAQIYFGTNCESKVAEKEFFFSSDKYLPFTHPDSVDYLSPIYLLKGSKLNFSTSIDLISNLNIPTKLCRFHDEESLMALTEARDEDAINEAEKKGKCLSIDQSSNGTLIDIVPSNGYYYYAISALSSPERSVNILYWYVVYVKLYNESDFEPRDCSVIDNECIFTGLTLVRKANPKENTFCILAFIPVPPSQEQTRYTFTTTLSNPIGFFRIMTIGRIRMLVHIISGRRYGSRE